MGKDKPPATGRPGGVGAGLRFLAAVRRDQGLREQLESLDPDAGLRPVVAVAAEAGFAVSAEELRAAFVCDWGLRQAHYLRERAAADRAANTVAVVHTPRSGM